MLAGQGPLFVFETNYTDWQVPDQAGKTVLITGANAGLGFSSAKKLAQAGATVLITCRNIKKCSSAAEEIRTAVTSGPGKVVVYELDTSDLDSVRDCAKKVQNDFRQLDVLMLNAGVNRVGEEFAANKDGLELTFVTNHLGHFLLTDLLRPSLVQGSRVVIVSSTAHLFAATPGVPLTREEASSPSFYNNHGGREPSTDLVLPSDVSGTDFSSSMHRFLSRMVAHSFAPADKPGVHSAIQAYCISKFANLLFAQELAERMIDNGIHVTAIHPGFVRTHMAQAFLDFSTGSYKNWFMPLIDTLMVHPRFGLFWQPEAGAFTQIFAATSPSVQKLPSGSYLVPQGLLGVKDPRLADRELQRKFWALSEELVKAYRT